MLNGRINQQCLAPIIELGENINKLTEDFHRVTAERDKAVQQLTSLKSLTKELAERLYDWQVSELWEQVDEDTLTTYNQWLKENE
jgi:hypothetical protein